MPKSCTLYTYHGPTRNRGNFLAPNPVLILLKRCRIILYLNGRTWNICHEFQLYRVWNQYKTIFVQTSNLQNVDVGRDRLPPMALKDLNFVYLGLLLLVLLDRGHNLLRGKRCLLYYPTQCEMVTISIPIRRRLDAIYVYSTPIAPNRRQISIDIVTSSQ